MTDLRARAEAFLRRPSPAGGQTPGIHVFELISRYALGGSWSDPRALGALSQMLSAAVSEANGPPGERRDYFSELAELLRAIRGAVGRDLSVALHPTLPGFGAAPPPRLEIAPQTETERRGREVQLLVNLIQPDPCYQPWLLTDGATALDVSDVPEPMIRARLEGYFGRRLPVSAGMPLWQLVDALKAHVPGWPDEWSPEEDEVRFEESRPAQVHPNPLEAAVLRKIAKQAPLLAPLLERLWVLSREFTARGSFTRFQRDGYSTHENKVSIGLDAMIRIAGVPSGMGAVLFLKGDQPDYLELHTHGDEHWDGSCGEFSLE